MSVKQPHSVPLQWLAETGLVGAIAALAGIALLLSAAVGAVKRRTLGRERLLAAALLAGAVAYSVHALYDWDWDIPGVTLPALFLLGVLAGWAGPRRQDASAGLQGSGSGARAVALGALALGLCVFTLSAVLPSLASSRASDALLAADMDSLTRAQSSASLASRLDPLSDAGPRAAATIALRRNRPRQAQTYLLDAVRRVPSDVQAWASLIAVDLSLGDAQGVNRGIARMLALDPRGGRASLAAVTSQLAVLETPPKGSATAAPLPPG